MFKFISTLFQPKPKISEEERSKKQFQEVFRQRFKNCKPEYWRWIANAPYLNSAQWNQLGRLVFESSEEDYELAWVAAIKNDYQFELKWFFRDVALLKFPTNISEKSFNSIFKRMRPEGFCDYLYGTQTNVHDCFYWRLVSGEEFPLTPKQTLVLLAAYQQNSCRQCCDFYYRLAKRPDIHPMILEEIQKTYPEKFISAVIARSPNISTELLNKLIVHESPTARMECLGNVKLTSDMLRILVKDPHWAVRERCLEHPLLDFKMVLELANDEKDTIKWRAIKRMNEMLDKSLEQRKLV